MATKLIISGHSSGLKIQMTLLLLCFLTLVTLFSSTSFAITEEEKEVRLQVKRESFGGLSFLLADQVEAGTAEPLLNFTVNDSLFINWVIAPDKIADFEAALNLPKGFHMAPVRILKGEGARYYLSLNLYNVTLGEPTVRAEWSVYVAKDDDPRPRFFVIEAHASSDSFDPVFGAVPASMIEYSRDGQAVSATIAEEGSYFSVQFSALFKRERDRYGAMAWAIANDKIYWRNGIFDKVHYNGSLTNVPIISIWPRQVDIVNNTAWSGFVESDPEHVLLYNNALEFAISPWNNILDPDLELSPDFREQLKAIKSAQFSALARFNALQIFTGEQEALFDFTVNDEKPSYFINFRVPADKLDPLAEALALPDGFELSAISAYRYQKPEYMISLNVYEGSGIVSGQRAEWSVYVRHKDQPNRPYFMVIDAATSEPSLDPVNLFTPAAEVFSYEVDSDNFASTHIQYGSASFSAGFAMPNAQSQAVKPSRDWVLANDRVYWANGIYDRLLYNGNFVDAKMLKVDSATLTINDETPWRAFVDPVPLDILVFQTALEFKILPWYNLEELPTD